MPPRGGPTLGGRRPLRRSIGRCPEGGPPSGASPSKAIYWAMPRGAHPEGGHRPLRAIYWAMPPRGGPPSGGVAL
ncbi:hypothetical protein CesoFtcFv8_012072 [Champsocephalus esox]|uniref:Uncharacterized protein n=1 Tax=Champsocephalus esox TaxID=159716 RepID=A0AAN8C2C1_9TELE|nr:hypothetical protein CesoFtcFv8_012072 [Champsocephalus esox]